MSSDIFSVVKDTRTHQPADLSRGGNKPSYSDTEMNEAVETLGMRADFLAEKIGVGDDRGPYYRDFSGTTHLLLRSVIEPLNRIANGDHDSRKAKGAASTVSFLLDNPDKVDGMYCADPVRIAELGDKISDVELAGGDIKDAISPGDLNYVFGEMYKFTYEVSQTLRTESPANKEDLAKYADCLDKGVKWAAKVQPQIEAKLKPEMAATAKPASKL